MQRREFFAAGGQTLILTLAVRATGSVQPAAVFRTFQPIGQQLVTTVFLVLW